MKSIKYILTGIFVIFLSRFGNSQFQIDSIAGGRCLRQAAAIKDRQTQRTEEYRRDLEDYKKGRFCSDCSRPASRVEREDHISFEQHIHQGGPKRIAISATKEMYEKLYKDYKNDYDKLEKQYWGKRKECDAALNNEINTEETAFNFSYQSTLDNLSGIKRNNPDKAANYENQFGAQLRQIQSEFQSESSKGKNASPENLKKINDKLYTLNERILDQKEKYHEKSSSKTGDQPDNNQKNSIVNRSELADNKLKDEEAQKVRDDSIRSVLRKHRTELSKQIDKSEDASYVTAATGVASVMMLINDAYVDDETNLKFHLGLGYESLPIIANDFNHSRSSVQASEFPNIHAGFEGRLNLAKNGGLAIHLNPFFTYGWGAFSDGESGLSMSYGGSVTLFLSKSDDSKIHLFGEGAYIKRNGSWHSDYDATLGTASDIVFDATYDYSVLRYGGGIKLQFVNDSRDNSRETYLKPGFFFEKPSFASGKSKPVMIGNVQLMLSSMFMIDFSYSKNYVVAGEAAFKNSFQRENKDYFSVKLIRKGLLAPRY